MKDRFELVCTDESRIDYREENKRSSSRLTTLILQSHCRVNNSILTSPNNKMYSRMISVQSLAL